MTATPLGLVFLTLSVGLLISAYIMSRAEGHRLVDLAYTIREYMFAVAMFTAAMVRFDLIEDAEGLRFFVYIGIVITTFLGILATAKARFVHRWLLKNHPEVLHGYSPTRSAERQPD